MSDGVAERRGALEALERILDRGGDADDVLRAVVRMLPERLEGISAAGIRFVEGDALVLGPWQGPQEGAGSELVEPVRYDGGLVAQIELHADAPAAFDDGDSEFLERVALLVSPFCLVGWDTGGETWSP